MTQTGDKPAISQRMIAKHLQVSVSTVSKALGQKPDISEAMRLKVEKAANELGYRFGSAGRQLMETSRPTQNMFIGVFLRRPLENGGKNVPTYMDGMARIARDCNVSLVVQEWKYLDDPLALVRKDEQPTALRDGLLSGVALGGEWPEEVIHALSLRQPVVLFPQSVAGCCVDVVSMDNASAMQQIVRRLTALGHRRIGFLGRCSTMTWANERFAGYVSAIGSMGLVYRPEWVLDVDDNPMLHEGHDDYWQERMDRIEAARNDDGVEAWVCSSDWPAFQLYRGMSDRGYTIPGDLSVTGFDDTEPIRLGCPAVTSVQVPREAIGEAALKRLLRLIRNPHSKTRQSNFACQIMLNGTIGSPTYANEPAACEPAGGIEPLTS